MENTQTFAVGSSVITPKGDRGRILWFWSDDATSAALAQRLGFDCRRTVSLVTDNCTVPQAWPVDALTAAE
jgi:hypothetical protein